MEKDQYKLSNPQKSIWVTEQYYKGTGVNTICGYNLISDIVNFDVLKNAIQELVKRNSVMRTKLKFNNNEVTQYIDKYQPFEINTLLIKSTEDLNKKINEIASQSLDIEKNQLFKFYIFKLPNNTGGVIVNVHHLIGDSWSLGLIAKEVIRIYEQLLNNTYEFIEAPSYLTYIKQEEEYKASEKYLKDKEYWNNIFETIPEVATIPTQKDNKNTKISCKGKREKFTFNGSKLGHIKEFCNKNKISIYNFFMAVYSIYISRVSNIDDFVIGTPILNRTNFEQKHTMGMFVNVVPQRIILDSNISFAEHCKKIAVDSMSIFRHQKYLYQAILEDIRKKDSTIPNLYNIVLSYQITKTTEEDCKVKYTTDWVFNGTSADDLQIHLFDINDENKLTVAYDYKSEKYDEEDIKCLQDRIINIIDQVLQNDSIKIKDIDIVTPEEKQKLIVDFNNTKVEYLKNKTIIDLFEEQVKKTPNNIAVVYEDKKLTYRELNEKANQLTRYIKDNGANKNTIIGIMLPRSLEMIISILAVLKAGSAYLPIDPDYPKDRIEYILSDSKSKILISLSNISCNAIKGCKTINLDEDLQHIEKMSSKDMKNDINYSDLAYIIYTSGSTGKPKGVKLKHLSLTNLVFYCNNYVEYLKKNTYRAVVSVTTVSFDIFIFETLISLQRGLKLVIANEKEQNIPKCLDELIEREKVEIIQTTPSRMQIFYNNIKDMPHFKYLKYITLAGEQLPDTLVKNLKNVANCRIYNGYGPSETTVFSTLTDVTDKKKVSIGRPLYNTQIYILNKDGQLCPIGVTGEICISGDGVGYGYINNEELTKKSFVPNPFVKDSIMYKTGDLGYYNSKGEIFCLGRTDNQVKIRGLRIELGEIEKVLLKNPGISNCAVIKVVDEKAHEFLCAYLVKKLPIEIGEIKTSLHKELPNYMVPQYFVELDDLPYTPNGKIDRKKLPIPKNEIEKSGKKPRNKMDMTLVAIFKKNLKIENINIEDSLFDIGGDSLTAINISAEIYNEIGVAVSVKEIFEHSSVEKLSDYITAKKKEVLPIKIRKAKNREFYPLSSAQKRIYYSSIIDNDSTLYNIAGGIIVDSKLNVEKLKKCFEKLIQRHEALRTHFDIKDNEIVQIIDEKVEFDLQVQTYRNKELNEIYNEFVKPFDLAKAPLFRAKLVNLKGGKMLFLLDMHHIISDGTSLNIILQELCDLYNGKALRQKTLDYKDFTLWEKEQVKTEKYKEIKEFWVSQYKDEIPLLNMPTSYTRPSTQSFEGTNYHIRLPKNVSEKIEEVSKKLNITPYMMMLSVYYILLQKYTSQNDIIVGTPIIGREMPELSDMLGMFVNTLALRSKIDTKAKFNEYANQIKDYCINAFKNQTYPFDELVKELDIKRDTSRSTLIDTMFIFQNNGYPVINFKNTKIEYFVPDNNVAKYDLSLEVIPIENEYDLRFEYCVKLFSEGYINRFAEHYINILNAVLENNEIKIADIDMLSIDEKDQILNGFNNIKNKYPKEKTIIGLFGEQAKKNANNIAVAFREEKLTYKELNNRVNKLSNYLLDKGVSKGDIVCTLLPRSIDLIISLLAIMKCGAIYVPISIGFPNSRIKYIIEDSKAKYVITSSKLNEIEKVKNIKIDKSDYMNYKSTKNHEIKLEPEDVIYNIYTSGSTGKPKGAQITNINLNNFIHSFKKLYDNSVNYKDKCLSSTSISFDVSIWEIFFTLLNGATLYLYEKETIEDIFDYCDNLINNKITMAYIPPNILNEVYEILTRQRKKVFLKKILIGVEPIKVETILKYYNINPKMQIVNGYGPTETTICTTAFKVQPNMKQDYSNIPIGKPLHNMNAYVLNNEMDPVPVGVPGELYVCGDNVGKGYLNHPELTKKAYIPSKYNINKIMYKTGDIVKWMEDGNLVFVGRNDNQIKIKGHRIEINEIVNAISEYPTIIKNVVLVKEENNNKILIDYFTATKEVNINDLRSFLSLKLPYYSIPNYLLQLEEFKITSNGKTDMEYLKNVSLKTDTSYEQPRNEFEKNMVMLWQQLLNVEKIGINDNFFELGGDSLIAIRLQLEAYNMGIKLSYGDIFTYPTIKQLSEKIIMFEDEKNIAEFDYKKTDELLSKNKAPVNVSLKKNENKGILLTGATGFVGIHVLDKLLTNTQSTIYCLVRNKNNIDYTSRLKRTLKFYFNDKYDDLINTRIKIIEGDIVSKSLGLSTDVSKEVGENISCVINSAAVVKHFGNSELFGDTNIEGVKNIIEFCKKFNAKLYHISTLSVSGNVFADDSYNGAEVHEKVVFKENNLYIKQDLSNIYVYSKFVAEKIVFDAINNESLNATVIRLGNITSRQSDGKFQINVSENAFLNRLNSFINLKCIPNYLMNEYTEFTPVDSVAEAICKIVEYQCPYTVLHLFNNNHIVIKKLIRMINQCGIKMDIVDSNKFMEEVNKLLKKDKNMLSGIINDFSKDKKLVYESDVKLNNDFSNKVLRKMGFGWPKIDKEYIKKYVDYLKEIKYIE